MRAREREKREREREREIERCTNDDNDERGGGGEGQRMKYWESGHRQGCRRPTTLQREDCISGHALAQSTMDGPSHSVAPEISRTAGASTEFPGRCAERGSWLRRRRRRTTGLPGRRSRRAKRRRPPRRRWRPLRRRRMTRRPARRRSGPAVSRTAGSSRAWTTPARTAVCVCVCVRMLVRL